ncbi:MAG: murein L,D-transpeptidase [Desulfobacterales bacterium]|nr:murein L,D-transpeptidase [Desulfobacterales bacterium]
MGRVSSSIFAGSDISIPSSKRSKIAIKRVQPTLEMEFKNQNLQYGSQIFMRIFKESKELEIWVQKDSQYVLFKTYKICTYSGSLGPKIKLWDMQAPEGFYFVTPQRLNPNSDFHLSFNLGYPNEYDRSHKRTGSALMVHGNCVSIGCYAMTDSGIEEIYAIADAAFRNGQKFFRVHIFPFRMTKKNMENHQKSEWIEFWNNLKQGYDYFENKKIPPNVKVKNRIYVFEN